MSIRPRAAGHPDAAPAAPSTPHADDPVCGMTVAAIESNLHLDHDGTTYWFCGPGCQDAFAADPGAFLSGRS